MTQRKALGSLVMAACSWAVVSGVAAGEAQSARLDSRNVLWSTGDLAGGDVRSLAIDPSDPERLLAGTATGQIYRSVDGGSTWRPAAAETPFEGWVISDLIFDSESPSTVWAAVRGILGEEGFVALSRNGGGNWETRSEGLPMRQVYTLALAPGRVYAGTRLGVWASSDDGDSWRQLTGAHREIRKVTSLLVDPQNPRRIFAGTWRRAYRSEDGGETWQGIFNGMALDSEVFTLQPVPDRPGELWASTCGWVYRGRGFGDAWQRFAHGLAERRTPSFLVLDQGSMLAGTVGGVYRTESGGQKWWRVTPENLVALTMERHPSRPERVFVGTEGAGVWRSMDGGRTFQPSSRGINAARIASMTALGGEVLAAVRHSGPASGVYSSFDGGRSYLFGPIKLPGVVELANDGESVFAATTRGLWQRRGDAWDRVEAIGETPVRQVLAHGGRVVVRTDRGLFLRGSAGEPFHRLEFDRGKVASVALDRNGMWISSASGGLYRVSDEGVLPTATPIGTGRIHAAGGRLLISGADELWQRSGLDAPWQEIGHRMTFHPTGNDDYPVLIVDGEGKGSLLGPSESGGRVLGLSVPARDPSAALVVGERLLVGTSGYGLLVGELPERTESEPPTAVESAR